MHRETRLVLRITGAVAVLAGVVGVVRFLLPPLLREIFTVLLEAWAIAVLAYVAFVALLTRIPRARAAGWTGTGGKLLY